MMTDDGIRRRIADAVLWVSVGMNTASVGLDLEQHRPTAAGLQSLVVVGLVVFAWLLPKIGRRLDADLQHAIAAQQVAEITRAQIEDAVKAGRVMVGVDRGDPMRNRVN